MTWTDERIALLKKLWKTGANASEIAAELGGGVSRNAVIGKVHRLLGTGAKTRLREKIDPAATPVRRRGGFRFNKSPSPPSVPKPTLPIDLPDEMTPTQQRQQLLELGNCSCRWPIGTPGHSDFFFCGGEEADFAAGRSYCKRHTLRAKSEARPR
jgi:GcrA cell cycle regulator